MWYKEGQVFTSQQAIRLDNPNMSLPNFISDTLISELGYIKVTETPNPANELQIAYQDGIEFINNIPTTKWVIVNKTEEQIQAERDAKTLEILTTYKASMQEVIDKEAQNRGYDDINSIAKYQSYPNTYQDETVALGKWCSDYWTTGNTILNDVKLGNRELPTIEEVLLELPKFTFTKL